MASIEEQLAELSSNVSGLTNLVAGKFQEWDNAVNEAKAKIDSFIVGAKGKFPLPDNLVSNSFMIDLEDGKPVGFWSIGVDIEAVHPFTKGFEGPYVAEKPTNAVDSPEYATADNPYWYGRYYKGPRISRGGLADGWGGIGNGHILKITAPDIRDKSDDETPIWRTLWLPQRKLAHTTQVGFRCYLKIVKGSGVSFGVDAGYDHGRRLPNFISKEKTDESLQGWHLVDIVVGTSDVVRPLSSNFCIGFPREEIEVYIALPYAYIPFGQKHIIG